MSYFIKLINSYFFCVILGFAAVNVVLGSEVAFKVVVADYETDQVHSIDDAADDSVVVNFGDESLVIGSDKDAGFFIYDIKGQEKARFLTYPMNNVDLLDFVDKDGKRRKIIAGSMKKGPPQLIFYEVFNKEPYAQFLGKVELGGIKPYGLSTGKNKDENYVFFTTKKGEVFQYNFHLAEDPGASVKIELKRKIKLSSKCEGLAYDRAYNVLYVAEEDVGLWKIQLTGEKEYSLNKILDLKVDKRGLFQSDLEGVDIYKSNDRQGYVLVSVQGNDTFAVFDRESSKYLLSFKVKGNGKIDDVTHTDGISIISQSFMPGFKKGILVVQDDENYDETGKILLKQNFKIISWAKIENLLKNNK